MFDSPVTAISLRAQIARRHISAVVARLETGTDLAVSPRNYKLLGAQEMLKALKTPQVRRVAKWCAYGLALAAPGSLVVLPLWLLRRHLASRAAWARRPPRSTDV